MKVNRDNLNKVKAQLKKLGETTIAFGCIPGAHPDADMSYSELMDIHERGARLKNGGIIPARAPFRNTFRDGSLKSRFSQELQNLIKINTTPKGMNLKAIQEGIGEWWAGEIKDKISQGLEPALKPSTMAARARKGIGGNLPLFATHRLRDSIDFEVLKK